MKSLQLIFTGVDKGVGKTLGGIGKGFSSVTDAIGNTVKRVKNLSVVNNVIGSISLKRIGDIRESLSRIGQAATEGVSGAAQTALDYNKMIGRLSATTTLSSKQLSSMFEMYRASSNKSIAEATEGFDKIVGSLSLLGDKAPETLKAFTPMFNIMDSMGGSSEELAATIADLSGAWEMSNDQIKIALANMQVIDKRSGMAGAATKGFSKAVDGLSNMFIALPSDISDTIDLGQELVKLTAIAEQIRKKTGATGEAAMDSAMKAYELSTSAFAQMQNMMVGMGGEFPELMKSIGMTGVSIEDLGRDPTKMLELMTKSIKDGGPAAKHLGQKFKELLGDENLQWFVQAPWEDLKFDNLITGADEADKAINKMSKTIGATAKTAEDMVDIAQQNYKVRLVGVMQDSSNAYVKAVQKGFGRMGKVVEKFAKDDGPIGKATQAFMMFQRFGVGGALTSLGMFGKEYSALGAIISDIDWVPIMMAFGSMGVGFGTFIPIIVSAVGGFFLLKKIMDKAGISFGDILGKFNELSKSGGILNAVIGTSKDLWSKIGPVLNDMLSKVFDFISRIEWGKIFSIIFEAAAKVLIWTIDLARKILPGLLAFVGKMVVSFATSALVTVLSNIPEILVSGINLVSEALGGLFSGILQGFGLSQDMAEKFGSFLSLMGKILLWIATPIAIVVGLIWAWTTASAALAATWLANPITWIVLGIVAAIALLVVAIKSIANNWEYVVYGFKVGLSWVQTAFGNFLIVLGNIIDTYLSFVKGAGKLASMLGLSKVASALEAVGSAGEKVKSLGAGITESATGRRVSAGEQLMDVKRNEGIEEANKKIAKVTTKSSQIAPSSGMIATSKMESPAKEGTNEKASIDLLSGSINNLSKAVKVGQLIRVEFDNEGFSRFLKTKERRSLATAGIGG